MLDQQHWVEAHERYAKGEVKAQLTAQIGQLVFITRIC